MELVSSFVVLLQQVSFVMTTPTFASYRTILTGWVFARRRTLTGMLVAGDAVQPPEGQRGTSRRRVKHHSAYHRVFAAARWSLDALGLAVFDLITPWLPEGTIFLALDDTLARKRGRKVFGVGMHHDPLLSSRKTAVMNRGHSWVVLGVIVKFPFRHDKYYCLPILFRLYVNKKTAAKKRLRYRTRPELAVEMLHVLCKAHENKRFHVVADSAYGGKSVFLHLPDNCDLTSRLTLDARLYDAPPQPRPDGKGHSAKRGRPRKRGPALPGPREMLHQRGRRLTLNIYGRRDYVRVIDQVAHLYAMPDRPVRVVAVEPLKGGRKVQAFFSTCAAATAEQVLTRYARRWSIEETFQQAKTQLGFEQPQGWTRRSVERTAPTAMLLYGLIVLWFARVGHRYYQTPHRPWYRSKRHPSFADMLTTLRRESIRERISSIPLQGRGSQKIKETLLRVVQNAA